tara:strand:- start:246 stop:578 length:333 start_codon:yes stop_codon:yes gene_type:complete
MTTVRLGDFLQEKALNMRKWLREQLDEPQLLEVMDTMLKNDFVVLGDECLEHKTSICRRDFRELMQAVQNTPLFEIAQRVRAREELHDKFWRYMELFVDVTAGASFQPDG